jgi:hypothetical protein
MGSFIFCYKIIRQYCSSPTSPCRYVAVLSTRSVFAALVVEIVGSMSSWISGNITCDWITTWSTEHLLDGTWLLVNNIRYMCVSVHYTPWFIDRFAVTRAAPELTLTPGKSQDRSWCTTSYVLLRPLPGTEVLLCRWGGGLPLRKLALCLPHFQIIPKIAESSWCNIWHLQ